MATTLLRFADSFWDEEDRGIDILTDKLKNSEQTCQDLKKIYEIRAQIEKDYGERLMELSHYTLGEIELGTLATSMQRIPFAFETTARAHIDMAEQLNTTLGAPLTSFLKEQCELINARSHQMENSKHLKDMHQAHVEKAKQAHDEALALLKQKQENGEDLETVNNSLALADREWQHSVEILQEVTDKFTLDWKITCDLYQDLEERRINFIRSNIWAFANMMSSVYIVDDRGCEGIRTGLEGTDVRQDINDFILKYGTSVKLATVVSSKPAQHGTTHTPSTTIDTMSSAFQEVEDLLSDPGVTKRNSQDQQSIHSNPSAHHSLSSSSSLPSSPPLLSSNLGMSKGNHSNITTPRGSMDSIQQDDPQHQRKFSAEPASIMQNTSNYTSPTSATMHSPPKHISSATTVLTPPANGIIPISNSHNQQQPSATITNNYSPGINGSSVSLTSSNQQSFSNNNSTLAKKGSEQGQRKSTNNGDSDDSDDEPKRPLRVPKPREEKWTISARRNGPSAASRPTNHTNNTSVINGNNSRSNTPIPSSQASVLQPIASTGVKNKPGYLDPTVHPPPLQQQQQQQHGYYGTSQPQSNTLYPPDNYTTSSTQSSKRNSQSSLYLQSHSTSSSATSLNLDTANQRPTVTYAPSINPTIPYQPSTTGGTYHQPASAAAATYHQPSLSASSSSVAAAPALSNNRPVVATYHPPSDTTSAHQPSLGSAPGYRPIITSSQPPSAPTYQPIKNTAYPSSIKPAPSNSGQDPPLANVERLAHQSGSRIGIRPPEWQDQRQGELEGTAAAEYMKGEGATTSSPAKSGLQRYNSVNGPREPPTKDNYIASADLKNTRGFGQETVSILEEEDGTSIHDMNKKKNDADATKDYTDTAKDDNIEPAADVSTDGANDTPPQEAPKSGFSFNNIFFRKDKPAADDGLRLPDGTVYKHKVRAMWSYEAKIDSELSFQANDSLAVIRKQPDGWWEAEILDDKRRHRGLVPGNYMSLN
ncbi:hypothetical protein BC941DRAFT_422753 [Chlamydoabsidia padenii]|nr:hypothetical protein BC941DRAFT_422753 [Chlamydoabsidia padenii]